MLDPGDRRRARYAVAAREIVPLLPPRGVQHSHGYLSTLRGAAAPPRGGGRPRDARLRGAPLRRSRALERLHDRRRRPGVLRLGRPGERDVARRGEGRLGRLPPQRGLRPRGLRPPLAPAPPRDGPVEYLERAERCLVNGFAHNQFANGDFGSRVFFDQGIQPSPSVDRAWWCCTMHGYRAFRDVLDHAVVERDGAVAVQLFEDVDFRGTKVGPRVRRTPPASTCEVTSALRGRPGRPRAVLGGRAPRSRGTESPPRPGASGGFLRLEGRVRHGRPDRGAARAAPAPRHSEGRGDPARRPRIRSRACRPLLRPVARGRRRADRPGLLRRALARQRRDPAPRPRAARDGRAAGCASA